MGVFDFGFNKWVHRGGPGIRIWYGVCTGQVPEVGVPLSICTHLEAASARIRKQPDGVDSARIKKRVWHSSRSRYCADLEAKRNVVCTDLEAPECRS